MLTKVWAALAALGQLASLLREGVGWFKLFMAKRQGAIEERARAAEGARAAEQEMTDIIVRRADPEELRRKLDSGQF